MGFNSGFKGLKEDGDKREGRRWRRNSIFRLPRLLFGDLGES